MAPPSQRTDATTRLTDLRNGSVREIQIQKETAEGAAGSSDEEEDEEEGQKKKMMKKKGGGELGESAGMDHLKPSSLSRTSSSTKMKGFGQVCMYVSHVCMYVCM